MMRARVWLSIMAVLFNAGVAQADPLNIRIGWATIPGSLGGYFTTKPELLAHYGKTYTVEPIHFANSPLELTGLAADEVDIAELTYPPLGAAIENAKMDDIRLIESQIETDVPGYSSDQYMVLKTSSIKTLDDLKGKVVATNGIGAAGDVALRYVMKKHGMEVQHDFSDVEVAFANMKAALAAGKIDMGMVAPPYVYDAGLLEIARPLPRTKDEISPHQQCKQAARDQEPDRQDQHAHDHREATHQDHRSGAQDRGYGSRHKQPVLARREVAPSPGQHADSTQDQSAGAGKDRLNQRHRPRH
jgi:sulfonate transport system substrate-binding protein